MGYNMIGRQGNVNMVLVIDVEIDVLIFPLDPKFMFYKRGSAKMVL